MWEEEEDFNTEEKRHSLSVVCFRLQDLVIASLCLFPLDPRRHRMLQRMSADPCSDGAHAERSFVLLAMVAAILFSTASHSFPQAPPTAKTRGVKDPFSFSRILFE